MHNQTVKAYFDEAWYLSAYPDVASAKVDAWEHYQSHGRFEGRFPCYLNVLDLDNVLWSSDTPDKKLDEVICIAGSGQNKLEAVLAYWVLARWYASVDDWKRVEQYLPLFFSEPLGVAVLPEASPWLLLFTAYVKLNKIQQAKALLANSGWVDSPNKKLAYSMLVQGAEKLQALNKVWSDASLLLLPADTPASKQVSLDSLPFSSYSKKDNFANWLLQRKKVTVIIPCFNAESTIGTALSSLLQQSWRNIEILVVDDCSTDQSVKVVGEWARKDKRIRLISHSVNQGAYAARNTALQQAKGHFITVHDSDDWSHPDKLRVQAQALQNDPSLQGSISHWVRCDNQFNFQRWRMEDGWIFRNTSSLMFRSSLVKKIGYWDCVSVSADTEYYYRILRIFGGLSIKEVLSGIPLSFGRVDSASLTQQSATNLRTLFSGVRKDYHDAALKWHEVTPKEQLYLSASPSRRPFPVPNLICRGTPAQKAHNDQLLLQSNPLFDADWYLEHYPDVKDSGLEPLQHYCLHGARENRDPGPLFSTSGYRYSNPDQEIDCNPLVAWQSNQNTDFKIELVFTPILGGKHSYADAPSLIMCGHLVTEQWFGAERSFLDVLSVLSTQTVNVIAVLPSAMCSDYVDRVRELAQQVVIVPYHWWRKGRAPDSDTVGLFNAIIRRFDASLLYTNTLVLYEPLVAAKEMDVTSVVHARELAPEDEALCSTLGASAADVRSFVLEHADHVIANSLAVAQYINDERCYIVPNMIRVDEFSIGNMPLGARLAVGMLSSNLPKKGLYDFVELARWCQAHNVPADFKLFGPDNAHVQKLRMDGELPSNLTYCGYVDKAIDALKVLDIIVNLSHVQESFGRSILEAMAAKRCVVAYQWGALTELVKPQCGYLVPFQDIESVAKQILYLCDNRSELCNTAENAVNMVRENYEQQQFAEQLLAKESPFSMLLEK
ncbi:glycosyltransferase [Neptunomonas sp. CHC150]|uniref:glycosyltransferase n=1 Tax=Neptunomonas sp. CHC150 TaxID=2998324 RepID=UPI0025B12709|nr:glycosyltransferase [Neptunomonas sp. CHC150]MDN2661254.1 glycosyltransferase [Neptunomonas sp. CHC150]